MSFYRINRISNLFIGALVLGLTQMIFFQSSFAAPVISDLIVTDVTPASFSVIWSTNEPSTPDILVFSDEDGDNDITSQLSVTPHPVRINDSDIVTAAEDNGVMKVRVTGSAPETTYYFQTKTTAKIGGEVTWYPAAVPMLSVITTNKITRSSLVGDDEVPFSNDLIRYDCYLQDDVTPAIGTLLVAFVAGGAYPVTGFVGDGVSIPQAQAYVDLNNVFNSDNLTTMPLAGGESLTFTQFMGIEGIIEDNYLLPENNQLVEMKYPDVASLCEGDFDGDNDVDGTDLAFLAADPARMDLASFALEFANCP